MPLTIRDQMSMVATGTESMLNVAVGVRPLMIEPSFAPAALAHRRAVTDPAMSKP